MLVYKRVFFWVIECFSVCFDVLGWTSCIVFLLAAFFGLSVFLSLFGWVEVFQGWCFGVKSMLKVWKWHVWSNLLGFGRLSCSLAGEAFADHTLLVFSQAFKFMSIVLSYSKLQLNIEVMLHLEPFLVDIRWCFLEAGLRSPSSWAGNEQFETLFLNLTH